MDKQARLLEFGEDVPASLHYAVARKKRLRLLSEVVPGSTVKRSLAASFAAKRKFKAACRRVSEAQ